MVEKLKIYSSLSAIHVTLPFSVSCSLLSTVEWGVDIICTTKAKAKERPSKTPPRPRLLASWPAPRVSELYNPTKRTISNTNDPESSTEGDGSEPEREKDVVGDDNNDGNEKRQSFFFSSLCVCDVSDAARESWSGCIYIYIYIDTI